MRDEEFSVSSVLESDVIKKDILCIFRVILMTKPLCRNGNLCFSLPLTCLMSFTSTMFCIVPTDCVFLRLQLILLKSEANQDNAQSESEEGFLLESLIKQEKGKSFTLGNSDVKEITIEKCGSPITTHIRSYKFQSYFPYGTWCWYSAIKISRLASRKLSNRPVGSMPVISPDGSVSSQEHSSSFILLNRVKVWLECVMVKHIDFFRIMPQFTWFIIAVLKALPNVFCEEIKDSVTQMALRLR
ncbi:hypothetical protein CEXT_256631, partial [Caerostris extrusa]